MTDVLVYLDSDYYITFIIFVAPQGIRARALLQLTNRFKK